MKKLITLLLSTAIIISITACVESNPYDEYDETERQSTTTEATTTVETTATIATTATEATLAVETTTTEQPAEPTVNAEILPQWDELYELNNDLVGWIEIPGTQINYPVVQRTIYDEDGRIIGDNTYYFSHDFMDEESVFGTIFVDRATPIIDQTRPDNAVMYGHNMNNGSMFSYVTKYFVQDFGMDAIINHPVINFETIYDNDRNEYKIFAGAFFNTEERHGEVYRYFQKRFLPDEEAFFDFISNVMDRSVFYTEIDLEFGDEFLTLATVYSPLGGDSMRFVLFARRVRPDESASVNTDLTYMNPSPLYFDYYYEVRGGEWDGRNWDTSKVKGFDEFYGN
ncbi:MAG: class B sortase [Oscillospiraceae bacterium]|nr:class B sortase [Oscillospiraceae bacterium]